MRPRTSVCPHLFGETPGSVPSCGETKASYPTVTHSGCVCKVTPGVTSLLCIAREVEGWSQAGRGSRGGAPGRQMGDDCGPPVGQNRSQRGVQRTGLRHREGCLAGSLYGSRWVRINQKMKAFALSVRLFPGGFSGCDYSSLQPWLPPA